MLPNPASVLGERWGVQRAVTSGTATAVPSGAAPFAHDLRAPSLPAQFLLALNPSTAILLGDAVVRGLS
jgi:hypothetical protein